MAFPLHPGNSTFLSMKYLIALVVVVLFSNADFPSNNNDLIVWQADRKLSWSDFRGSVNYNSHGDAATAVRISAQPYYERSKLRYKIEATFIPTKSWYKTPSESLLAHEQLHFDIAELYARKARRKVQELKSNNVRDIELYNAAIQEILNESNDVDVAYDIETLHGSLPKAQESWTFRIALELNLLQEFSN